MKKIISNNSTAFNFSLIMVGLMVVPVVASAASAIVNFVTFIETLMSAAFPILTGLGIVVFGYNVMKYLTSKNLSDQNLYKAGIWNSLIALFIIFVLFGLIRVVANSLGIPVLGTDIGIATGKIGDGNGITSFREIALTIARFGAQRFIPIMIGGAVLFFIGNIVISMTKSDNEEERTNMNAYLKWGFIALFVLLTFFGIVSLFTGSLFGTKAIIPQFQTECPSGQDDC
jgi:hypothetical protein